MSPEVFDFAEAVKQRTTEKINHRDQELQKALRSSIQEYNQNKQTADELGVVKTLTVAADQLRAAEFHEVNVAPSLEPYIDSGGPTHNYPRLKGSGEYSIVLSWQQYALNRPHELTTVVCGDKLSVTTTYSYAKDFKRYFRELDITSFEPDELQKTLFEAFVFAEEGPQNKRFS